MKTLSGLAFVLLFTSSAWADDVVKPDCQQPIVPIANASEIVTKMFEKRGKAYEKCIDKFVKEQQAISAGNTDVAKANAAHDAADLAIKEYNEFMVRVNERNRQARLAVDRGDDEPSK